MNEVDIDLDQIEFAVRFIRRVCQDPKMAAESRAAALKSADEIQKLANGLRAAMTFGGL